MAAPTQMKTEPKKQKNAITPTRAEDFPLWYQEVVKQADLAENAPVRGCMIIKPNGYAIWERVQEILGGMIRDEGVRNAYFPLLIPLSYLSKEAEHVDGFATETAVVTHHRLVKDADGKLVPSPDARLTEPLVIRPTSETIIGEALSGWINSYRDLPYKLNQWCNVMRWEMRPRIFLRTSEFLWQEGHNVFETAEDARADALKMLDVYADFLENYMALPGIKGEKTEDERFPGAVATYTFETMMQDGKALQSCTSHDLGQTFSKSANIQYQGRDGVQHYAWTTSWGLSTRTIGGLIMTHGDDDGIILPPKIAPQQIAIIPFLKDEADTPAILEACDKAYAILKQAGLRVAVDKREERSADKIWASIKQGIPLRIEIGAREAKAGEATMVRRDLGKPSNLTVSLGQLGVMAAQQLDAVQAALLQNATHARDARVANVNNAAELRDLFAEGHNGWARLPVSELNGATMAVRKEFSLTPRCLPFHDAGRFVLIGKSY